MKPDTLILCDIDGCLNNGKLAPLDLAILVDIKSLVEKLKHKGIGFSLCTGRPQPYAEAMCTILDVSNPIICENGSLLFDPILDRVIPLVSDDARKNIQFARDELGSLAWLGEDAFFELGKEFSFSITGRSIESNDEATLDQMCSELRNRFSSLAVDFTHSASSIDVTLNGINKGSAIDPLLAHWKKVNKQPNKLIGIGDSAGDMSFLLKMDQVFTPSNGAQIVKDIADRIAVKSHAAGTLELLTSIE